jgi:hypothetical protein
MTYTSINSNSSRFRCLERKAAARFLTRRASRLLRPETSGGTKSLVLMRSAIARGFFVTLGAGLAASRFDAEDVTEVSIEIESAGDSGACAMGRGFASGKSKTW